MLCGYPGTKKEFKCSVFRDELAFFGRRVSPQQTPKQNLWSDMVYEKFIRNI